MERDKPCGCCSVACLGQESTPSRWLGAFAAPGTPSPGKADAQPERAGHTSFIGSRNQAGALARSGKWSSLTGTFRSDGKGADAGSDRGGRRHGSEWSGVYKDDDDRDDEGQRHPDWPGLRDALGKLSSTHYSNGRFQIREGLPITVNVQELQCLNAEPVLGPGQPPPEEAPWEDADCQFHNVNEANGPWEQGTRVRVYASPLSQPMGGGGVGNLSIDPFNLGSQLQLGFQGPEIGGGNGVRAEGGAGYVDGFGFPVFGEGGLLAAAMRNNPAPFRRLDITCTIDMKARFGHSVDLGDGEETTNTDGIVVGFWPIAPPARLLPQGELPNPLFLNPWHVPEPLPVDPNGGGASHPLEGSLALGTWAAMFCAGDPSGIVGANWREEAEAENAAPIEDRRRGAFLPLCRGGKLAFPAVCRLRLNAPSGTRGRMVLGGDSLAYLPSFPALRLSEPVFLNASDDSQRDIGVGLYGYRTYPLYDLVGFDNCEKSRSYLADNVVRRCFQDKSLPRFPALEFPPVCNSVRLLVSIVRLPDSNIRHESTFLSVPRGEMREVSDVSGGLAATVVFQYASRDVNGRLVTVSMPLTPPRWAGTLTHGRQALDQWFYIKAPTNALGFFVGGYSDCVRTGTGGLTLTVRRFKVRAWNEPWWTTWVDNNVVGLPVSLGPMEPVVQ